MLCNYGYDVQRCFDCPYGNSAHIPEGYEGWSNSVIKDTLVMEQRATSTLALIRQTQQQIKSKVESSPGF